MAIIFNTCLSWRVLMRLVFELMKFWYMIHFSSWLQFCTLYFFFKWSVLCFCLASSEQLFNLKNQNPLNIKVALQKGYLFKLVKRNGSAATRTPVSDWVLYTTLIIMWLCGDNSIQKAQERRQWGQGWTFTMPPLLQLHLFWANIKRKRKKTLRCHLLYVHLPWLQM